MNLNLVPLTQFIYDQQLLPLYQRLGEQPPTPPQRSFVLLSDEAVLVAFVGLYEAKPFLLAEYFALNPDVALKVRHQAATTLVELVLAHCAANGLVPIAAPRSRGLAAVLERYGFNNTGIPMYVASSPMLPIAIKAPTIVLAPPAAPISSGGELEEAVAVGEAKESEQRTTQGMRKEGMRAKRRAVKSAAKPRRKS